MKKRRAWAFGLAAWGLAAAALPATVARGHPLRFGVLHLDEHRDGTVDVSFRFSGSEERPTGATVRLPERCRSVGPELRGPLAYGETRRVKVDCGERGLAGATVGVDGLHDPAVRAALRIDRPEGRSLTATLSADAPTFAVPPAGVGPGPASSSLTEHVTLGVRHILEGMDHLLFVLGLLLLVGMRWKLVGTLTAFTVGHSLTLALATLGYADVPQAPVEAAIALSILLLAVELAHELRPGEAPAAPTLTRRHPGVVAALFGLLHGLGFAGALTEAGLGDDLVRSLLGFNLGVELGQLLFVAVVLVGMGGARRLRLEPRRWGRHAAIYGLGVLGTFFFLERVTQLG
ncbi:MAG: HupE/UreJ family protein [Myxococcota bacterium]